MIVVFIRVVEIGAFLNYSIKSYLIHFVADNLALLI